MGTGGAAARTGAEDTRHEEREDGSQGGETGGDDAGGAFDDAPCAGRGEGPGYVGGFEEEERSESVD